jgi:hypothetical protein
MSWNFCPWCGHRLYQHNDGGCLHVDIIHGDDGSELERKPCDCKHGNPLLAEAR